jgi:hypothetical protein
MKLCELERVRLFFSFLFISEIVVGGGLLADCFPGKDCN